MPREGLRASPLQNTMENAVSYTIPTTERTIQVVEPGEVIVTEPIDLAPRELDKLRRLGGSKWVRKMLQIALEMERPMWHTQGIESARLLARLRGEPERVRQSTELRG